MANVLCIGLDDAAMKGRAEVLRQAGHVLSQAKDLRQVVTACSGIEFDVVVIGHSLPAMEKLRVGDVVRKYCRRTQILELYSSDEPELATADVHLRARDGASEDLVATIHRMTAARKSA